MIGGYQKTNLTEVAKATQYLSYSGKKQIIICNSATEQKIINASPNIIQRHLIRVTNKDKSVKKKAVPIFDVNSLSYGIEGFAVTPLILKIINWFILFDSKWYEN